MAITGLQELFVQGLQAVYDAEQQGLKAAPSIAERATHPELEAKLQEQSEKQQDQEMTRLAEQVVNPNAA